MGRNAMIRTERNSIRFYYSRKKMFLYLLFNLWLLLMATLFTISIFPEYPMVYRFSLFFCLAAVIATVTVLLLNQPVAEIDAAGIRIDRCAKLFWKDVVFADIHKIKSLCGTKKIITFKIKNLSKYKLNFMQKLNKNSQFTVFSIPLYAMDQEERKAIATAIYQCLNAKPL